MNLPQPMRPCPYCSSTSFARLKEAHIELAPNGSYSSTMCPAFNLLLCLGCGRTDWFVSDVQKATVYFGGRAERVDIGGQSPFR